MTELSLQVRPNGQGPFDCILRITQEYVEVIARAGAQIPDQAWEFVDEAGHYHSWSKDEASPTLERRVGWRSNEIQTVCVLCAEPVTPAYTTEPTRRAVPGPPSWEAEIFGFHLAVGSKVSLSFSGPATGRVRYFGVGCVVETGPDGTKVLGQGPLGRKK